MARFVKYVRNGELAWPTQREYKPDVWSAAFKKEKDGSTEDQLLHESGLVVYEHLQRIREVAFSLSIPMEEREVSRLFCAMANRSFWWIQNQWYQSLSERSESTTVVDFDATDDDLFTDYLGNNASTDGSIEIAVDGVTVPLRLAMHGRLGHGDPPDDLEVIRRLTGQITLGQTYTEIESFWKQCVWEGYHVKRREAYDIYVPSEHHALTRAVGQYRHDLLLRQDSMTAISVLKQMPVTARKKILRTKILKAVGKTNPLRVATKSPRRQHFEILSQDLALIGRMASLALYLEPMLREPLPGFGGLSVDNILEVWSILTPLAEQLVDQFHHAETIDTVEKLLEFAPTVSRPSLEAAVRRATDLSKDQARRAVNILTFNGERDDTLWLQPLVRTSHDELAVVVAPLLSINMLWLIERLLAKGEADLESRGPEFERSVREQIGEHAKNGELEVQAVSSDVELEGDSVDSSQPEEEQIDLVIRIGSVILVGEVKCQLFPNTSALRRYNYWQTLESAADQAKRKTAFAEKYKDQFLEHLGWTDSTSFSFQPVVITNVSLGVGFEFEGVPIADIRVVGQFLEQGTAVQNALVRANTEVISADVEPLYDSPEDAPGKIVDYLRNPPQIRVLQEAVTVEKRRHAVPPSSDKQKRAVVSLYAKVRASEESA